MGLVTKEEFVRKHERLIAAIANGDAEVARYTEHLIRNAWEAGYAARKEEVMNMEDR